MSESGESKFDTRAFLFGCVFAGAITWWITSKCIVTSDTPSKAVTTATKPQADLSDEVIGRNLRITEQIDLHNIIGDGHAPVSQPIPGTTSVLVVSTYGTAFVVDDKGIIRRCKLDGKDFNLRFDVAMEESK